MSEPTAILIVIALALQVNGFALGYLYRAWQAPPMVYTLVEKTGPESPAPTDEEA